MAGLVEDEGLLTQLNECLEISADGYAECALASREVGDGMGLAFNAIIAIVSIYSTGIIGEC